MRREHNGYFGHFVVEALFSYKFKKTFYIYKVCKNNGFN